MMGSTAAPPPDATRAPRLHSIRFLRGLAALAVVCSHAATFGNYQSVDAPWLTYLIKGLKQGTMGVPLFFVISGFCIHFRHAKELASSASSDVDYWAFWRRRFVRLYPPYFAALIASMGLVVACHVLGRDLPGAGYPSSPSWIFSDFMAHVFLLHGFFNTFDMAGGNPPYWTLAREEYLYALYFALLATRRISSVRTHIGVLLGLSVITPFARPFAGPMLDVSFSRTSVLVLWIQWYLGFVAVEGHVGLRNIPSAFYSLPLGLLCAAVAHIGTRHMLTPALLGLAFFCLLNHCVRVEELGHWPDSPAVAAIERTGDVSYSLYLIHFPAIYVAQSLVGRICQVTGPWTYLSTALLLFAISLFAGSAFFELVERRFLTPQRGGSPGRRTPPPE